MSNVLVAYFSASGVTARVADRLAKSIGADLFEIKPENAYFSGVSLLFLGYQDSNLERSPSMAFQPRDFGGSENLTVPMRTN